MDMFYWIVGYVVISLLWIFPASLVLAILINGILVSSSITIWELRCRLRNNIKFPSVWIIVKITLRRVITESLTDSNTTITGKYGRWNYLFKHTIWEIDDINGAD